METVYLETTIPSYLVAHPSRDLLVAAHQQATCDWWRERRHRFDCYISQVVIDEAAAGDPVEAKKRLAVLDPFRVLQVSREAESLTKEILASGAIPAKAVRDAAHIAVAATNDVDYLLTWNCRHLANAQIMRRVSVVCNRLALNMPLICTPEELMGD